MALGLPIDRVHAVSARMLLVHACSDAAAPDYESGGQEFESLRARQFVRHSVRFARKSHGIEAHLDPTLGSPASASPQKRVKISLVTLQLHAHSNPSGCRMFATGPSWARRTVWLQVRVLPAPPRSLGERRLSRLAPEMPRSCGLSQSSVGLWAGRGRGEGAFRA
jgi:hypothetical protein